ncbi:MAG: hypothetical protein WC379_08910 [Methanoregula sp.]|jgi:hypothetical protein
MATVAKKTVTLSPKQFTIPADLLKTFSGDIRFFPVELHPNGYILFDRKMLISVLERGTDVQRKEMVNALKKLGDAGAEMVIMQHQTQQV